MHRYTLGFVFGDLLRQDLDEFVADWNAHPIRLNKSTRSPHGRPVDIYDMPELHYGKYISECISVLSNVLPQDHKTRSSP